MRVHSVTCRDCGSRAVIRKTDPLHDDLFRVYYSCKNDECGARFVFDLTYSHHTHPSALKVESVAASAINCLSPEQRQAVAEMLKIKP